MKCMLVPNYYYDRNMLCYYFNYRADECRLEYGTPENSVETDMTYETWIAVEPYYTGKYNYYTIVKPFVERFWTKGNYIKHESGFYG